MEDERKIIISLKTFLSFPKILWFNLKIFPLRTALKLPVWIHYKTKIVAAHKGCIKLDDQNIKHGMIRIGCSMGSAGVFTGAYPKESGGGYIDIKKIVSWSF